jgi:Carboxypeptidase regulatory-like domain/Photosynthesis system II assembly factor YCF48/Putative zinc-finger
MSADNRDQQFERALARLLRDASPSSACPDAETLSAYHERTLPPDQMAALKEHIAACTPCQEVLALVEQSGSVPLEEWQNESVPMLAAASVQAERPAAGAQTMARSNSNAEIPAKAPVVRVRTYWRWLVPVGVLAAGLLAWVGVREVKMEHRKEELAVQTARNVQSEPTLSPPKTSTPSAVLNDQGQPAASESFQQLTRDKKVLPATPPTEKAKQESSPSREGAIAAQRNAPAPSSSGAGGAVGGGVYNALAPPVPQFESNKISRQRSAGANPAQNDDALPMQGRSVLQLITPAPAPAAPPPPAPAASPTRGRADDSAAASMSEAKKQLANPTNEKGHLSGRVTDPSGAVVAGTNVQLFDQKGTLVATTSTDSNGNYSLSLPTGQYKLELQQSGFKTDVIDQLNVSPGENRLNGELQVGSVAETVEVAGQASAVETTPSAALEYSTNSIVALNKVDAPDHRYVSAVGGKYLWRLGQAGKIDRSSDRGKTWQAQKSGITADLTAGSATSEKICWVVGKAGTILLTTDSGRHWKQIASPITGDLGGIRAADETHATVWDAANSMTFATTDGGATWTRAAQQ